MEAKETAGLPMTERVARDCSSGLLETTSNRLWSAAKMNTHQLLQKKERERGRGEGGQVEKGQFSLKNRGYKDRNVWGENGEKKRDRCCHRKSNQSILNTVSLTHFMIKL